MSTIKVLPFAGVNHFVLAVAVVFVIAVGGELYAVDGGMG